MNRRRDKDEIFREECRRRMQMPSEPRLFEGFIGRSETYVQERVSRSFATMAEYRLWCHENLPPHLGFRLSEEAAERDRAERNLRHRSGSGDDRQKPL